jgi:hypothetical protein
MKEIDEVKDEEMLEMDMEKWFDSFKKWHMDWIDKYSINENPSLYIMTSIIIAYIGSFGQNNDEAIILLDELYEWAKKVSRLFHDELKDYKDKGE